ncbi:uncharacterized protein [Physcomitrium patens]|uniref:uncharacterized protein n=1 Tax=Physcomitrium patens TaxID=3218 RepID=UPI003CCD05B1
MPRVSQRQRRWARHSPSLGLRRDFQFKFTLHPSVIGVSLDSRIVACSAFEFHAALLPEHPIPAAFIAAPELLYPITSCGVALEIYLCSGLPAWGSGTTRTECLRGMISSLGVTDLLRDWAAGEFLVTYIES